MSTTGPGCYHGHAFDNAAGRAVVVLTSPSPVELIENIESPPELDASQAARALRAERFVDDLCARFEAALQNPNVPREELLKLDAQVTVFWPQFHCGKGVRERAKDYGVNFRRLYRWIDRFKDATPPRRTLCGI